MEIKRLKRHLTSIASFALAMGLNAQNPPTDEGPWHDPWGTWAGDTIIFIPTTPIGGGINTAPSLQGSTIAIYFQGNLVISTPSNNSWSYTILNEYRQVCYEAKVDFVTGEPYITSLSSLPSGRYSLLLYINKECLEGEFEKE